MDPLQEQHYPNNDSTTVLPPAGAHSTAEALDKEGGDCDAASGAVKAEPDSVPDPHSVQRDAHAPAELNPPAATAAVSASSAAAAAPAQGADSTADSRSSIQLCLLDPADDGDGSGVTESAAFVAAAAAAAAANGCSLQGDSRVKRENSPSCEAHETIQLRIVSALLSYNDTPPMPSGGFCDWKENGLPDGEPCAKRVRRADESAPACLNPGPIVFKAGATHVMDLHGGAEGDAFPIRPSEVLKEEAAILISPGIENYDDLFWGEDGTLDGPVETHKSTLISCVL
ncbi:unnamed protein product [Closterium sp. Yama58-4]|nr:unnamed protein product [Closterium sp. Yama58-4]